MTILKNKKYILLLADILLLPMALGFRELAKFMLTTDTVCRMVRLGGKCITCGGTHFVKALCSGQFVQAFQHNSFLFILTGILLVSYILLHFSWWGNAKFSDRILRAVYSTPGLIIFLVWMILFFLIRNIPLFIRIAEAIAN